CKRTGASTAVNPTASVNGRVRQGAGAEAPRHRASAGASPSRANLWVSAPVAAPSHQRPRYLVCCRPAATLAGAPAASLIDEDLACGLGGAAEEVPAALLPTFLAPPRADFRMVLRPKQVDSGFSYGLATGGNARQPPTSMRTAPWTSPARRPPAPPEPSRSR